MAERPVVIAVLDHRDDDVRGCDAAGLLQRVAEQTKEASFCFFLRRRVTSCTTTSFSLRSMPRPECSSPSHSTPIITPTLWAESWFRVGPC